MAFQSYIEDRDPLIPPRLDINIAHDAPVRIIDTLVSALDVTPILALYAATGRAPYNPIMMLKVLLFAYMNNIYSCRAIEEALTYDVRFIWLAGYNRPDYITINRFRLRIKEVIHTVFAQLVLVLADHGYLSLDVAYVDGTKLESKANRYTFVWKKNTLRYKAKLLQHIQALLEQIDQFVAQEERTVQSEQLEVSRETLRQMAEELRGRVDFSAPVVDLAPDTKTAPALQDSPVPTGDEESVPQPLPRKKAPARRKPAQAGQDGAAAHAPGQDADSAASRSPVLEAPAPQSPAPTVDGAAAPAAENPEIARAQRQAERLIKQAATSQSKLATYNQQLEILGPRNSYAKTDPSATFMRMKEDHLGNGQTKPAYNLQIATNNQFITDFGLYPNPGDTLTLIPFLQKMAADLGQQPTTLVSDAGYGAEENYSYLEGIQCRAFVKYNYFHREQQAHYAPHAFSAEGMYYNAEADYYVCPRGQHMLSGRTTQVQTPQGYLSQRTVYRTIRCEGCPLRGLCFKGQGNREMEVNHRLNRLRAQASARLASPEGIKHRKRRCIEPEAVFGQTKNNMGYRRFRHVGQEKVMMDFALFAMGFNLKKMCSALARGTHPAGPSATKPDKGSGTHTTLAPTPGGSNVTPACA